jgi:hypothetical protein
MKAPVSIKISELGRGTFGNPLRLTGDYGAVQFFVVARRKGTVSTSEGGFFGPERIGITTLFSRRFPQKSLSDQLSQGDTASSGQGRCLKLQIRW